MFPDELAIVCKKGENLMVSATHGLCGGMRIVSRQEAAAGRSEGMSRQLVSKHHTYVAQPSHTRTPPAEPQLDWTGLDEVRAGLDVM